MFEPARSLLATVGEDIVAHLGSYARALAVPGAELPAAHLARVAGAPTHRHQGLLTRLMRHELDRLRAEGEALAVLWASEGRIYQLYGFGLASTRLDVSVDTAGLGLRFTPDDGAWWMRELSVSEALPTLVDGYGRLRRRRVGWSGRPAPWWERVAADHPAVRHGATAKRVVLAESMGGTGGYAVWRGQGGWSAAGPHGAVEVCEFVSGAAGATRALWRYLLTMDLTRTPDHALCAVDDPLLHLVEELRRLRGTMADGLWVRVVDVPTALAGRRYPAPLDVVLAVQGPAPARQLRPMATRR